MAGSSDGQIDGGQTTDPPGTGELGETAGAPERERVAPSFLSAGDGADDGLDVARAFAAP